MAETNLDLTVLKSEQLNPEPKLETLTFQMFVIVVVVTGVGVWWLVSCELCCPGQRVQSPVSELRQNTVNSQLWCGNCAGSITKLHQQDQISSFYNIFILQRLISRPHIMAEAVCIILDTGFTASQKPEGGKSFLDISQELASLFVERRLFSESKDEICLVLAGSEETNNSMDYDNIAVFERGFGPADWDLVTFLRSHVEGTQLEADWLDSVIVAMDMLRTAQEQREAKKKFSALRIFLFSELGVPCNNDQLDNVLQGMAMINNLEFTFIGPGWKKDDDDDDDGDNKNGDGDDSDPGPSTSKGEPSKPNSRKLYPTKTMSRVQKTNGLIVDQLVQ